MVLGVAVKHFLRRASDHLGRHYPPVEDELRGTALAASQQRKLATVSARALAACIIPAFKMPVAVPCAMLLLLTLVPGAG